MSCSLGPSTKSFTYCRPEQPPPITARRSAPFRLPFSSSKDASLHAAFSVTLIRRFYLQQTEVTQDEWTMLMGNQPFYFTSCGGSCPACATGITPSNDL